MRISDWSSDVCSSDLRDLGSGRDPAQQDGASTGATGRERRLVKVDGVTVRGQQVLAEVFAVVWLTPQMDGLFRESASGRRRFLDRLVYGFDPRSEEHTSELQSLMRISYAVFCLKKK